MKLQLKITHNKSNIVAYLSDFTSETVISNYNFLRYGWYVAHKRLQKWSNKTSASYYGVTCK